MIKIYAIAFKSLKTMFCKFDVSKTDTFMAGFKSSF